MDTTFCCVSCQSDAAVILDGIGIRGDVDKKYGVRKCSGCGLVQLHPCEYAVKHYEEDGQTKETLEHFQISKELFLAQSYCCETNVTRRIRFLLPHLGEPQKMSWIDVGAGEGSFCEGVFHTIPEYVSRFVGLEPSKKRVLSGCAMFEHYRENAEHVHRFCDAEYAAANKETFDVVTCIHTLEHVSRPKDLFGYLFDLVTPGGILYVEVPNMDCKLVEECSAFRDVFFSIHHISYFNKNILGAYAVGLSNAKILQIGGHQMYSLTNYMNWIRYGTPQKDLETAPLSGRSWIEKTWMRGVQEMCISDAVYIILRKEA